MKLKIYKTIISSKTNKVVCYWESDVVFGEFTAEYNPETNEVCHCIDDENVNSELKEEIILSLNKILKELN